MARPCRGGHPMRTDTPPQLLAHAPTGQAFEARRDCGTASPMPSPPRGTRAFLAVPGGITGYRVPGVASTTENAAQSVSSRATSLPTSS